MNFDIKTIEPLDDRIAILVSKPEDVSPGGIVLPDSTHGKQDSGTVFRVGPGKLRADGTRITPTVKVGDEVIFNKFAGSDYETDDGILKLVHEQDIYAIVTA